MNDSGPSVPLLDMKAQYSAIKAEVDAALQEVIDSQHFINGPAVAALEADVARYCGASRCVGVSSGSDALLVALMALDIGPGDEVITTPYTFFATVGAIVRVGATPVFCDIDPTTYNIDPSQVAAKVTSRTKAIIPVHLYGQCADMGPILDVAGRRGIAVIEDAAQAIGSEYEGRRAGSMGVIGCLSFFPSKNLGAFGDGGAVTVNDAALAEKIACLRVHGSKPKYFHRFVGGNFRLDTIQAAVLRVKLKSLDRWTAARQANAAYYDHAFMSVGLAGHAVVPPQVKQTRHIFNQYVLRVENRDALRDHLTKNGVGNEIYYPLCMHQQECFENLGYRGGEFPEAEKAAASTVAIPVHPELTESQRRRVVEVIAEFYGANAAKQAA